MKRSYRQQLNDALPWITDSLIVGQGSGDRAFTLFLWHRGHTLIEHGSNFYRALRAMIMLHDNTFLSIAAEAVIIDALKEARKS